MTTLTYKLLIFLFMFFHSALATANSMRLDTYAWSNCLVILMTDKKGSNLEKQVKEFFTKYTCDIDERNIKLLHFYTDKSAVNQLPKTIHSHNGLWLLGYDGSIKAFSEDSQLLNDLFQTIDKMPLRQDEVTSGPTCN